MSCARSKTLHDHSLNFWKFLIRAVDVLSLAKKTTLALCSVASISLILYFAVSNRSHNFPPHPNIVTNLNQNGISADGHEKTNISHVVFGIGGSVATWDKRRHYTELWWKPNVTRGFVWLDQIPSPFMTWVETLPQYKVSGDTSRFKYSCPYGSRSAVRLARIVKESFELGLENVRWFVMGDDDTVYFPDNLVSVLAKYDHNQMYYIGGNSESVEQDEIFSYTTAYGGGGFAISYPLAAELVKILDGCIDRYDKLYGSDQKIQGCLSEIGVPLTKELGFHQLDIRGNPYGLLAAHPVTPLVSLHHFDYVESIFPNLNPIDSVKKLVSGYKVDPGRTVQHSFCYDLRRNWSVSVSWGYTVQLYPFLVTAKKLETSLQTFWTWKNWDARLFTFNTQPVSSDPCERSVVYMLDRVESVGGGGTLTTYNRYNIGEGENDCNRSHYAHALKVEVFNVSAPKFNPDLWNKLFFNTWQMLRDVRIWILDPLHGILKIKRHVDNVARSSMAQKELTKLYKSKLEAAMALRV